MSGTRMTPSPSPMPGRPRATVSALADWWRALRAAPVPLSLALQGGGAHGAFTWGVLDRLLEDPRIEFDGLSGSSAGAMNAVLLADGWLKGGREGARQSLSAFWTTIGQQMTAAMVTQGETDAIDLSPSSKLMAIWAGYFSPSQFNPFDLNPLRDLLKKQVDFDRLRAASPFKLFVGTTSANTGKLRVFREHELSLEVMLASACLPKIHHAVEIDGEPYWDGGYSANPALFPLFDDCDTRDVLLVLLSPLEHEGTPKTVEEIEARIAELTFSTHFMREMRMFAQAAKRPGSRFMPRSAFERRLQGMRFHMIDASGLQSLRRPATKALAYGPFLQRLRDQGRERATVWLDDCAERLGHGSTLDVVGHFG